MSKQLAIALCLHLFLVGCSGEPDKTNKDIESYAKKYGVDADVETNDAGSQNVTINHPGGMGGQVGTNLKLPAGFPDDVAIYPGTKIMSSTPAGGGFTLTGQSTADAKTIAAHLESEMIAAGWTTHGAATNPVMLTLQFKKGQRMANYGLLSTGKTTSIQISTLKIRN